MLEHGIPLEPKSAFQTKLEDGVPNSTKTNNMVDIALRRQADVSTSTASS
jgi:hypothetical protein